MNKKYKKRTKNNKFSWLFYKNRFFVYYCGCCCCFVVVVVVVGGGVSRARSNRRVESAQ